MGYSQRRLKKKVLSAYSLPPCTIQIIQEGRKNTVWMVNTQQRTYCLKKLNNRLEHVHFSIQAQKYLKDRHAQVPAIVNTQKGASYVIHRKRVFVLYEWIHGIKPDFSSKADLKQSIQALARLHIASNGFVPRSSCRVPTKWGKWPKDYDDKIEKLRRIKRAGKFSHKRHKRMDEMIEQGNLAQKLLSESFYARWIRKANKEICHTDFKERNVVKTRNGCVILDLDRICLDLPVRDLRQIVHAIMLQKGKWDKRLFKKIVAWYTAVNPFTVKQRTVLYIDCLFPHLYCRAAASLARRYSRISSEIAKQTDVIYKIERAKRKYLLREIKKQ